MPAEAVLRPLSAMQTRPIQSKSFLMYNLVCLEEARARPSSVRNGPASSVRNAAHRGLQRMRRAARHVERDAHHAACRVAQRATWPSERRGAARDVERDPRPATSRGANAPLQPL